MQSDQPAATSVVRLNSGTSPPSLTQGPTKPLALGPVTEKDKVESAMLEEFVAKTSGGIHAVVDTVLSLAQTASDMLVQQCRQSAGAWSRVLTFGSSGLGATTSASDIDMYVG